MHWLKEAASPQLLSVLVRRMVRMAEVLISVIGVFFLSFSKGFEWKKGS